MSFLGVVLPKFEAKRRRNLPRSAADLDISTDAADVFIGSRFNVGLKSLVSTSLRISAVVLHLIVLFFDAEVE